MKILSHRGYWESMDEKNSACAFTRSLKHGFGLETDVRDCAGKLVISHDMPRGDEMDIAQFIALTRETDRPLALNVKADGLAEKLRHVMHGAGLVDWFVFDMSIPDMRSYIDAEMPTFARVSEVEKDPPWIDKIDGIWFDKFYAGNYDVDRIKEFISAGKRVCVVSPELHGRPYQEVWQSLTALSCNADFMLCTDFPVKAETFFSHACG
jgi:hypothetical protein